MEGTTTDKWRYCGACFVFVCLHTPKKNLQLESKLSHFGSPTKFLMLLSAVSMCPVWVQEEERFTRTLFGVSPRDLCDFGQSWNVDKLSCGGNPRKRVQFHSVDRALAKLESNKLLCFPELCHCTSKQ